MMKRSLFVLLGSVAVSVLLLCGTARAQIGLMKGRVMLRRADGLIAPQPGATVDIFNLDSGSKIEAQTDAQGHYISVGMEHNHIYLLSVSAARARPAFVLKRNSFDLNGEEIILEAGDGKRPTREEALAQVSPSRIAFIRALRAGKAALQSKKYDKAIAIFEEALAAMPDAPALWTQKATAYKMRGFASYLLSIQTQQAEAKAAYLAAAGRDFRTAYAAGTKAVELVKSLPVPTQPGALGRYQAEKYAALEVRARAAALLVDYTDRSIAAEAFAAYQEYLRVESEWHTRAQAQIHAAEILRREYGNQRVIEEYRRINAAEPDNMDVIALLGLALFESGDKSRFPEAARLLQSFIPYGSDEDHPHPLWSETRTALESMRR
jgi:tetratricopeptide (TPR) repeat protein